MDWSVPPARSWEILGMRPLGRSHAVACGWGLPLADDGRVGADDHAGGGPFSAFGDERAEIPRADEPAASAPENAASLNTSTQHCVTVLRAVINMVVSFRWVISNEVSFDPAITLKWGGRWAN